MKGLIKIIIFSCFSFLAINNVVNAETFYQGEFISGEYINKEIDGKTYYMTMQYIKDSSGHIVYCLEPFVKFEDGKSYVEYSSNLEGYDKLTNEQKKKISLIIYYGYGYGNRTDSKWYVVTQYLVWKVVDDSANIYFTKTLNGNKINKYLVEQDSILNDVNMHNKKPDFVKDYFVDYGSNTTINGLDNNFEIINSDYLYSYDNNGYVVLNNLLEKGNVSVRKISNYYDNNVVIYDSNNSQDVIKPGNVVNDSYDININVRKGDITLDIRDDNSVYTIESDFTNTCYDIMKENMYISSVCTGDKPIIYKTDYLSFGKYTIIQRSAGKGYVIDKNVYMVEINENLTNPTIVLYNKLLKNKIEIVKYYCTYGNCIFEKDAEFEIYNRDNVFVDKIITDNYGYSSFTLGYGTYGIKQVKGKDNYTLNDIYYEKIVDEESSHYKELNDYYIGIDEEEGEVLGEVIEIPVVEEIPNTKIDSWFFSIVNYLIDVLKKNLQFLYNLL